MKRLFLIAAIIFSNLHPSALAQLNEQYVQQTAVAGNNLDKLSDSLDSYYAQFKKLPRYEKDMARDHFRWWHE